MAMAYLDETGLHLPDYAAVLADLQDKARAIYGEDLYLDADSQDGQLLAIFADALTDAYALAGSVYNSYAPSTAQGVSLSRQVVINGLQRKDTSHSTAELRLVGTAGTTLTAAVASDSQDQRWLIPDGTVIPAAGEILVTATAEDQGDIRASAGDISTIATPTRGWHSVTNPAAAEAGAPTEQDAALRRRQTISTARPSKTVLEGIAGAVAEIDGVTRVRAYENDTDETDANGVPRKNISLVVEGGDAAEIADAIARRKTPGCGTHGDTAVQTTDRYGSPTTIRFWRPVDVAISGTIRIRPLSGYLAATGDTAGTNVVNAVTALGIGDDVLLSRLYSPINSADGDDRTFDILEILLAADGGAPAGTNVSIPYNGAATAAAGAIVVEVAP